MPHVGQQFQTELLLLQETSAQGERMRNHREALKVRLAASAGGAQGGLSLDELEHSVRCMIVGGRFAGNKASSTGGRRVSISASRLCEARSLAAAMHVHVTFVPRCITDQAHRAFRSPPSSGSSRTSTSSRHRHFGRLPNWLLQ